mmetsp:Transcript_24502/g.41071  ORF Transcript_24502/g.41071 Transcript_24502/m.41071 type:complete len:233 (+) Transcript_24502:228-926(+)
MSSTKLGFTSNTSLSTELGLMSSTGLGLTTGLLLSLANSTLFGLTGSTLFSLTTSTLFGLALGHGNQRLSTTTSEVLETSTLLVGLSLSDGRGRRGSGLSDGGNDGGLRDRDGGLRGLGLLEVAETLLDGVETLDEHLLVATTAHAATTGLGKVVGLVDALGPVAGEGGVDLEEEVAEVVRLLLAPGGLASSAEIKVSTVDALVTDTDDGGVADIAEGVVDVLGRERRGRRR